MNITKKTELLLNIYEYTAPSQECAALNNLYLNEHGSRKFDFKL